MSYNIAKLDSKITQSKTANLSKIPEFIYTFSGDEAGCCIANDCNFGYGIQSTYYNRACIKHPIVFVDNSYHNYNHTKHLEVIKKVKPKYCTVRDVMTKKQCLRDNIEFYEPAQILKWAEELRCYSENIIIIPKSVEFLNFFDWSKFIIGLPVPSSYGTDMLPLEFYKDKKVHLLGGSWKKQLSLIYNLGDNIVSLDNNYIHKIAQNGVFIDQIGETHFLGDLLKFNTNNTVNICLSLSLGAIKYALEHLNKISL